MKEEPRQSLAAHALTITMRRKNKALSELHQKAMREGWFLTPEGNERYDRERLEIIHDE